MVSYICYCGYSDFCHQYNWFFINETLLKVALDIHYTQERIQDFKLGVAHLKKLRRVEGGAKIFGVFRGKKHDFKPKNLIFSNFGGGGRQVSPLDPPLILILFCLGWQITLLQGASVVMILHTNVHLLSPRFRDVLDEALCDYTASCISNG